MDEQQEQTAMTAERALVLALLDIRDDVLMTAREKLDATRKVKWWYRRTKLEEQS